MRTVRTASGATAVQIVWSNLGVGAGAGSGPLEIVASRAEHLWEALCRAYVARLRRDCRLGQGVPCAGVGADHRADQQAGLAARGGGDRGVRAVLREKTCQVRRCFPSETPSTTRPEQPIRLANRTADVSVHANTSLSPLRPEWRTRREGSRPARQHVRIGVRPLATTAFLP